MTIYRAPGVYVVEDATVPIVLTGAPTGVPCFFGFTERGPSKAPTRLTSVNEFHAVFGKKANPSAFPNQYLADAVYGFFLNGGHVCYVCRVNAGDTAMWPINCVQDVADLAAIQDQQQPGVTAGKPAFVKFLVRAISPGTWGNRLEVNCEKTQDSDLPSPPASPVQLPSGVGRHFDLTVQETVPGRTPGDPPTTQVIEKFTALSTDPQDPRYYLRDGAVNGTSCYIELTEFDASLKEPTSEAVGSDQQPQPTEYGGFFELLQDRPEVSIIACPDAYPDAHATPESTYQTIYASARAYAEAHRYMVVMDPPPVDPQLVKTDAAGMTAEAKRLEQFADGHRSSYVAIYAPWVTTANLDPTAPDRTKLVPPSGLIVGAYNRSDAADGVWKAPANIPLLGPIELQFPFTDEQSDVLNPAGINAIRTFPGYGILIWGARTTSDNVMWQYVNVRRIFLYIERTVKQQMTAAVFEANNQKTWTSITLTVESFLREFWQGGGLMGTSAQEAFRVQCGVPQTMTMQDVEAGLLKVEIALAPVRPAEFVVFTITQQMQIATGGN